MPVEISTAQSNADKACRNGRAGGRMKGRARVRQIVPTAPLQISEVKGSSPATRRVAMNWAVKQQAVSRPKIVPTGCRPPPGRMTISTPTKAMPAATKRDMRAGSFRIQGASDSTSNGARKLMDVASAWGM